MTILTEELKMMSREVVWHFSDWLLPEANSYGRVHICFSLFLPPAVWNAVVIAGTPVAFLEHEVSSRMDAQC